MLQHLNDKTGNHHPLISTKYTLCNIFACILIFLHSLQLFVHAANNEKIKAPHYWTFMTVIGGFPKMGSNAESVSLSWRHHFVRTSLWSVSLSSTCSAASCTVSIKRRLCCWNLLSSKRVSKLLELKLNGYNESCYREKYVFIHQVVILKTDVSPGTKLTS